MLEGLSLKQSLIRAGYSPNTARTPKQHGLSAEACLQEARKLDPKADPGNLLASARKLLAQKIRLADPRKESLSSVARTVDIAEKHYKHSEGSARPDEPRTFAERIYLLKCLIREVERRGMVPAAPEAMPAVIDAEPVQED